MIEDLKRGVQNVSREALLVTLEVPFILLTWMGSHYKEAWMWSMVNSAALTGEVSRGERALLFLTPPSFRRRTDALIGEALRGYNRRNKYG